jgi:hypothetical protein
MGHGEKPIRGSSHCEEQRDEAISLFFFLMHLAVLNQTPDP